MEAKQIVDTLDSVPHLPPELIDLVLAALGDSADDRASRTALLCCSLVSKAFHRYAQRHYYRKFTIKYPIRPGEPLPEREHHLVRLFFDNPHILTFIQELVVILDGRHNTETEDEVSHHDEPNSPISQVLLLSRFPWPNPPVALANVPPLLLLLRHSPIHTAHFTHTNPIPYTIHVAGREHLAPICGIPSLRRFYFANMLPVSLLDDKHPDFVPGLERLELLWVASKEQEFNAPIDIPSILSPSQTSTILPSRQVIRIKRFKTENHTWLQPRLLFRTWFPDYKPPPDLEKRLSVFWEPKFVLDLPEVRDALHNMHNVCPSIRRVAWNDIEYHGSCLVDIIIERNV